MVAKPIPEGYNMITPYLVVEDAARAIEYYEGRSVRKSACAWTPRAARSGTPSSRSATPC